MCVHDALIAQLTNKSIMIRRQAQDQLVQVGEEAVEPLLQSLATSSGQRHKLAIIPVLAAIGDVRAAHPLIRELETGNLPVRIVSAEALGNFDIPEVFDALVQRLNTEDVMVQIWIVESLGKLQDRRAVGPLVEALRKADSPALQYSIIRVLGILGDPASIDHIAPFAGEQQGIVQGVARSVLKDLSHGGKP